MRARAGSELLQWPLPVRSDLKQLISETLKPNRTTMQTKGSCYSISPYLKQNKKDQKFKKKKETNVWHGDFHFQSKRTPAFGQEGLESARSAWAS